MFIFFIDSYFSSRKARCPCEKKNICKRAVSRGYSNDYSFQCNCFIYNNHTPLYLYNKAHPEGDNGQRKVRSQKLYVHCNSRRIPIH